MGRNGDRLPLPIAMPPSFSDCRTTHFAISTAISFAISMPSAWSSSTAVRGAKITSMAQRPFTTIRGYHQVTRSTTNEQRWVVERTYSLQSDMVARYRSLLPLLSAQSPAGVGLPANESGSVHPDSLRTQDSGHSGCHRTGRRHYWRAEAWCLP